MTSSEPALADVRVIDAGGSLSAYCVRLLADFGAEVEDGAEVDALVAQGVFATDEPAGAATLTVAGP